MADKELKKNIPGMIAAAGLALASGKATLSVAKAPIEVAKEQAIKPWGPEGLDPELVPIAHLESSWGKNMRHAAHPGGVFQTAFGAVGLKPQTGHEQYLRSPDLKRAYPGLDKPEDFTNHFQEDPVFYNKVASKHWQWLRSKLGSPSKASYGWRWGIGAATRTPEQVQNEDPYVQKFSEMSHYSLAKMAIRDVPPGKKKQQFVWDYTHLLTPENRMAGYQITVSFHPASHHPKLGHLRDRFHGEVTHHGKPIGNLSAAIHTQCLGGPCIEPHVNIKDGHTGRGLGTAMYEGLFKEAKMAGIKSIHIIRQSEAAAKLHSALARRHGMGYRPGELDGASLDHPHGESKYLIKTEEGEQQSNVRRLLSSDSPQDWAMAMHHRDATKEDIDFLLDRLATIPAESKVLDQQRGYTLDMMMNHRQWLPEHTHRAMQVPMFRNPVFVNMFVRRANTSKDRTVVDRMLDDVDVWAPKTPNEYVTSPEDRQERRQKLVDISESDNLTPDQQDRVLGLVHSEKLADRAHTPDFFRKNSNIHPDLLNKWLDYAVEGNDAGLIKNIGKKAWSSDAVFEKILKLPQLHSRRALIAYADSGNMTAEHFKHLLSHPSSILPPEDDEETEPSGISHAIRLHLGSLEGVSSDVAEAVLKHPNKSLVEDLANKNRLPPEIYRKIYEQNPDSAARFIANSRCPDDVRLDFIKKKLDSGEAGRLYGINNGRILNDNDESVPVSKEVVDLIMNHPNQEMWKSVKNSPHLTNEYAKKFIGSGLGSELLSGRYSDGGGGVINNPNIDKKEVVREIAKSGDTMARNGLLESPSWHKHLGPEFFDSIANKELARAWADYTNPVEGKRAAVPRDYNVLEKLANRMIPTPPALLNKLIQLPKTEQTAMYHPNVAPQDFDERLPSYLGATDRGIKPESKEYVKRQRLQEFLRRAEGDESPHGGIVVNNPIREKHLEYVKGILDADMQGQKNSPRVTDSETYLNDLYRSPQWSKERLADIWTKENMVMNRNYRDPARVRRRLLENPNAPDSIVDEFMMHPKFDPDPDKIKHDDIVADHLRSEILNDWSHSKASLKRYAKHFADKADADVSDPDDHEMAKLANEKLAVYEPDSVYRKPVLEDPTNDSTEAPFHDLLEKEVGAIQGHVQVRPGNQKLRKIRDIILEKSPEKGEIKPKDLPPGDWAAGRLPNGNISAKKINEHIEAQTPHEYNFSHGRWTGAQRHSEGPRYQKVFQVNLTNDMFDKLEAAGVDGTFRDMVDLSQTSSHPVRENHTLGWVRYDGNKNDGFHIDEIQSDFGQSFVRQAAQQAAAEGQDAEEAGRRAEVKFPEAHYGVIKNILFKDRHPNEMIAEAFHQYLRDQGHANVPVHMLDAKTKAPISGQDTNKPLPAHMQFTYNQLPSKKLGMEPASYGQIKSQANPEHVDKPTWKGKVRKFETQVADWARELGIEELAKAVEEGDFKGIARATDPTGPSIVDHRPHLESHPSGMTDEVNDYRSNVLESPTRNKRLSSKGLDGITHKVVYKTKAADGTENKYMIKPYHERVIRRVKDWMKHPIQGWAEMANQGLYHAAGIGDLHQKVHVSEHPMMGRKEPALVVHLAQGFKPVLSMGGHISPTSYWHGKDDLKSDVRKIGLMDYLTNNLDRHGLNLLVNPETAKPLAIDHSRSFQYKVSSKPRYDMYTDQLIPAKGGEDSLGNYMRGSNAISTVTNPPTRGRNWEEHHKALADWGNTIEEWWPKVSHAVRKELDKHLEQIKDPTLKTHIRRNFHARADLLDEMAQNQVANYGLDDWHSAEAPIYPYGAKEED